MPGLGSSVTIETLSVGAMGLLGVPVGRPGTSFDGDLRLPRGAERDERGEGHGGHHGKEGRHQRTHRAIAGPKARGRRLLPFLTRRRYPETGHGVSSMV
jgi:hypothetical protein